MTDNVDPNPSYAGSEKKPPVRRMTLHERQKFMSELSLIAGQLRDIAADLDRMLRPFTGEKS